LTLTVIGSVFIWAGWYSFNGGSALEASERTGVALINTHLAASTGSIT